MTRSRVMMKLDTDVMVMSRKGCLDNYDTLFCVGPHMLAECVESENIYHTKVKNKVKYGYTLLDEMRRKYLSEEHNENEKKIILIAPSWRVDNIIDLCLEELLDALRGHGYQIIVRPHPQEVKTKRDYLESVREKYESDDIEFQMDFLLTRVFLMLMF
jgi:YidC/Oxa1 family membrane protein insertase